MFCESRSRSDWRWTLPLGSSTWNQQLAATSAIGSRLIAQWINALAPNSSEIQRQTIIEATASTKRRSSSAKSPHT